MKNFFRDAQAKITQQLADTDMAERMRPGVAAKLAAGVLLGAALLTGGAPEAQAGGRYYTPNQTLAIAAGSFVAGAVVNQMVNNYNNPPPPPVQRVVVQQPPQVVYRVVQPPVVQYVAPPPPPPVVQYVAPPPMVVSPQPGQTVVVRPAGGGAPMSVPGNAPGSGFQGGGYDNPPPGFQPNNYSANGYRAPNVTPAVFNVPLPRTSANLPPYPADGFIKTQLRGPDGQPAVYMPEAAGFDGVIAATMVRNNIGVAVPGAQSLRSDPVRSKQLEAAELRVMSGLVNFRELAANARGGDFSSEGVQNNGQILQARAVLETDVVKWTEVRNKLAVQGYNVSVSDVRIRMASENLDELPQYKDPRKLTRTAAYAP